VRADFKPLVLCLVGTDHHPFQRLVSWSDAFAASRPDVDVLVQYGRSLPPRVAEGRAFLEREDLDALLARARVAVTHGGPGLISEVRAAGLRPLTVPRDPDRGEHVDRHQIRFLDRMDSHDLVELVTSQESFLAGVAQGLANPLRTHLSSVSEQARVLASVDRFVSLVEPLFSSPAPARQTAGEPGPTRHRPLLEGNRASRR
jgi:UDP-N-acetylglucosamine transferase subunit ALG13